ncbi:MAG TPA: gamma carbonic anhydrase family protein [Longimicrobiales bacterium]|nr:gamma carbonic anhydrase family protein [Longimicrobiales bacterium]
MAHIYSFNGRTPRVHESAFVAPTAVLIGDVEIGAESSVWFGAVLRGDHPEHGIRIGARVSVQDNCVLHVSGRGPTVVEDDATIGHGATFESVVIGRSALIGMNSVLLHGAIIGEAALVAALSVVPEGMEVPPRMLAAGSPAKLRRELSPEAAEWVYNSASHYAELSRAYLREGIGRVDR